MLQGEFFQNPGSASAFYDYQIPFSARFDRDSSSYMTGWNNNFGTGNRRKWTLSFWFKLVAHDGFGGQQYYLLTSNTNASGAYDTMIFDVDSDALFYFQVYNSAFKPEGGFRDTTSWGHLVLVYDSDNSTADDRRIIYLNGTRMTVNYNQGLSQNTDSQFNWGTKAHYIARRQDGSSSHYGDFYLAEWIFADGQAYAPTQFGETKDGIWIPKDPSGTSFGTTGHHLKFQNSSALGDDSSGNNNDFTVSNMGADHQVLDSPTFGSD